MTHIDSLRLFIRVVELGSITAGGRVDWHASTV